MTRVLLINVHPVVRAGLRTMLSNEPGVQVVGEADRGEHVLDMTGTDTADVLIIDAAMLAADEAALLRQITHHLPQVRILALSSAADRLSLTTCLAAGAAGYVTKDCAADELHLAIRTIVERKVYLSPHATGLLVDDLLNRQPNLASALARKLSAREQQVVRLISEGRTSREIARSLALSVRTIDAHRQQIMDKLKIRTVAELTKYAIREGLTVLEN